MFDSKIIVRYLIVTLLVGCGDSPVPAVQGFYDPEPQPEPQVVEVRCDQAEVEPGHLYLYAEADLADPILSVLACTEQEISVLPPVCVPTEDYSIDEEGVIRVLCGELNADPADFVRIESTY